MPLEKRENTYDIVYNVQTFVLVTALYTVFFVVFTVTMRLSLFLLNEHDDDDDDV